MSDRGMPVALCMSEVRLADQRQETLRAIQAAPISTVTLLAYFYCQCFGGLFTETRDMAVEWEIDNAGAYNMVR